jgi:hypothetical protein
MLSLAKEESVFEKNKENLINEGKGKFVVIQGETILSFFDSEEEALREGYKHFNARMPFLVRRVSNVENIHYFSPSPLHYGFNNK